MLVAWNYRYRNSLIDRIDPRARLIFSFAVLIAATSTWNSLLLAIIFMISILWYAAAKLSWKDTKRGWMMISILLFTMIVVNTIITGGGAGGVVPEGGQLVWPDGFNLFGRHLTFGLTVERLWFAVAQLMRILSISLVFIMIPYTMDSRAYGVTFRKLGLPDRLAYTMELSFRFIPTLARNFQVTLDAQRARGFELDSVKGGIFNKIKRIAPLIIPVTMNAIVSSEDIANAMDLRGFGQQKRTWLYELKYHWWDYAVIAFAVIMLGGVLFLAFGRGMRLFHVPQWWYGLFN
ncbi:MAG: energy-coupling factor transporter transmembrane protein EcfT [Anaerolineaceae bacterium]|jgi:energy-coupling factor transport system permease protein|nr:energy-coupling factor transporter transmembrane protein EcfT [Anaerolineaceae bacterium]MDI9531367.1 energy-coupling factor transporter transmembrane component T [Chloroflexota bacterium]NLE92688.1 energy-coupling factor transporter transmembrane protein EcfT [Chloroflexota bacterium]HOG78100.1 energy-coupling factor transporter transmembrane component T [Anaerolineaceae bacterium]